MSRLANFFKFESRTLRIVEALFVFGAVLCFLELTWDISHLMVFQHRDLERALQLTQGHWIFFGPESSGGGTLPGGYYYLLLSLPLFLKLPWESTWHWMMTLASMACAGMWYYGRPRWGALTMSLSLFFILLPNGFMDSLKSFMNPGFLPIFLMAFAVLTLQIFSENESEVRRSRLWILLNVLLAISLSVHFAMICIVGAVWLIALSARPLNLNRLSRQDYLRGALAFFALLMPYLVWFSMHKGGIDIGQQVPPYIGGLSRSLTTILANLWDIVSRVVFEQGEAVSEPEAYFTKRAFYILTPVIFGLILVSAVMGESLFRKGERFARQHADLNILILLTLAAFIPASIHFIYKPGTRYVIGFAFYLALTASLFLHKAVRDEKIKYLLAMLVFLLPICGLGFSQSLDNPFRFLKYRPHYVLFVLLFLSALLLALRNEARYWRKFFLLGIFFCFAAISVSEQRYVLVKRNERSLHMPEAEFVAKTVLKQTGWNHQQARERLFYVQTLTSSTVSLFYDIVMRKHPNIDKGPFSQAPDGFFVVRRSRGKLNQEDLKSLILKHVLEKQIRAGIAAGDISLGKFSSYGRVYMVPYTIKNSEKVAKFFNNRGLNYEESEIEQRVYDLLDNGGDHNLLLPNDEILITWNRCESQEEWGQVSTFIKLFRDKNKKSIWKADATVFGRTMSAPSHWITPSCTQSYHDLKMEFYCPTSNTWQATQLSNNLGFFSINEFRSTTHILLSPLNVARSIECAKAPTSLRLSWASRHLTVNAIQKKISGESTTLNLIWNKSGTELVKIEKLIPFDRQEAALE